MGNIAIPFESAFSIGAHSRAHLGETNNDRNIPFYTTATNKSSIATADVCTIQNSIQAISGSLGWYPRKFTGSCFSA
jgi:hypothetical protein